jgi:hypothetical protein
MLTGWNGDNCVGELVAEVSYSGFFHLGENHGANFLRGLRKRERKGEAKYRYIMVDNNLRSRDPRLCV